MKFGKILRTCFRRTPQVPASIETVIYLIFEIQGRLKSPSILGKICTHLCVKEIVQICLH